MPELSNFSQSPMSGKILQNPAACAYLCGVEVAAKAAGGGVQVLQENILAECRSHKPQLQTGIFSFSKGPV